MDAQTSSVRVQSCCRIPHVRLAMPWGFKLHSLLSSTAYLGPQVQDENCSSLD